MSYQEECKAWFANYYKEQSRRERKLRKKRPNTQISSDQPSPEQLQYEEDILPPELRRETKHDYEYTTTITPPPSPKKKKKCPQ
jgi:hypothetical protein